MPHRRGRPDCVPAGRPETACRAPLNSGGRRIPLSTLAAPTELLALRGLASVTGTHVGVALAGICGTPVRGAGARTGVRAGFSLAHTAGRIVPPSVLGQIPARVPVPARLLVIVLANVRVNGVGLFGLPGYIVPESPGITSLLLGFLLQPGGINLGLLGVSTGAARAGLLLPRIKLHLLRLPAHFGGLFAVRFVPFLFQCPAATARHQKHDQKDHHNNAYNHPNPRCNVQATHLFPLAAIGPRITGLAGASDPLISVTV